MIKKTKTCITIGWQWWDEWKWKLIDFLSKDFDIVVRSSWWANAGHTIYIDWKKIVLHLIPSWILQWKKCIIWNWCVVDLPGLLDEIHELDKYWVKSAGLLSISDRAHVVFSFYKDIDALLEKESKIWTTKRWIWPAYSFKALRKWIRVWDMVYDFENFAIKLRELALFVTKHYWIDIDVDNEIVLYQDIVDAIEWMVIDSWKYLQESHAKSKSILFEWAQWALLDLDHWTYPYVTSSSTISCWALIWTGFSLKAIDEIVAISKAYMTRVWNWPFPTELLDPIWETLRESGWEYWATTGRPRRCWWLDLVLLKKACMESWVTMINITKLDVLTWFKEVKVATNYKLDWMEISSIPITQGQIDKLEVEYKSYKWWGEDISKVRNFKDLPANAQKYISWIEKYVWVKIAFIWVWMDRDDFIIRA